jgi:hypothetical protein
MNALGKTTDGRRPRFHRHAGDAFEQGRRQDHIGFLAGGVQQMGAHHPQHQFETGADQQPMDSTHRVEVAWLGPRGRRSASRTTAPSGPAG